MNDDQPQIKIVSVQLKISSCNAVSSEKKHWMDWQLGRNSRKKNNNNGNNNSSINNIN